jgi:DNA-binding MarR family transcriptional regulator
MPGCKSRITEKDQHTIWTIYSKGKTTQKELAKQFGIVQQRISVILNRKWEALKGKK